MISAAQVGLGLLQDLRLAVAARDAGNRGTAALRRARVAPRPPVQYTIWALVIAAAILRTANVLPVLTTTALGATESDTMIWRRDFPVRAGRGRLRSSCWSRA
jgi:hypothetical protein